ncbi:MAG: BspA family leucine-rich repeat surface protein [Clostridium sp.]|nr:BspA family leucine-rich repeat surface protein [Clostridium sp.]
MKNKGFTLVELLAVIAILAILVIIALPNVLKMYNDSKKNAFMTEAQNLAKEVSSKYISESMKGNKVTVISNKQNPLDMTGRELEYNFELDSQGKIKNMIVSNGTYCISTNKDYTKITRNDISDKCSYEKLHNIVGTLKNKFYEESGRTDRSLVSSIVFYSDGRTINGAESYDVSEKKDGSIKMYVSQNSENTSLLDLTIVANGKIAFPEDSSNLFAFYKTMGCNSLSNLSLLKFNNSINTKKVKNMNHMFAQAAELAVYGVSERWNTSYSTKNIENLDLSDFDTSNVDNMSFMFVGTSVNNINFDGWNTSLVTDMSCMFWGSFIENLDLSFFNTQNVVNMHYMFSYFQCNTINLSSFDTLKVANMYGMFRRSSAKNIIFSNKFTTSQVANMSYMFEGSKATTLDLSSFDISSVTNMSNMFDNSAATIGYAKDTQTVAKFNDSSVTNIPDTLKFTVK